MHLVLRSSKAIDEKSFKTPKNKKLIQEILTKFSVKYGVQIISLANVGTHLHLHIKIAKRTGYLRFIRAVTASIAMGVSGRNRWTVGSCNDGARQVGLRQNEGERDAGDLQNRRLKREKFWDYRPFTRIIEGFRALLHMRDYIQINQLEGLGVPRLQARIMLANVRPERC
jgi:REP element-mobilizing transposase RayT